MNSRDQIASFYKAGLSLREIEKRLGVAKTTIRETLIKDGVARRNFSKNQKGSQELAGAMRSGTTPFGYIYLEGKLVIDPREYQTVLEIVRLRKSGNSMRAIAQTLNDRKIPTRLGKTWKHFVVSSILERHEQNSKKSTKTKSKGDTHGT